MPSSLLQQIGAGAPLRSWQWVRTLVILVLLTILATQHATEVQAAYHDAATDPARVEPVSPLGTCQSFLFTDRNDNRNAAGSGTAASALPSPSFLPLCSCVYKWHTHVRHGPGVKSKFGNS